MTGIEVRGVYFSIDGAQILEDVSLDAQPGLLGLIGPNGAGKTTLLRIISGYLKADSGSVLLDGADISGIDIKTRAKKMALVPQNYALDYDFTVMETVLMGRHPHMKTFESYHADDYALARECIKRAGIEGFEERMIRGLSGGEWQRMIIARALCQKSGALLLDEPVSNLDIKHQVGILGTVRELVEERDLVCVCVLHDLNLAMNYCTRIAVMKDGRVCASGTPDEVMTKELLESIYDTKINVIDCGGSTFIAPVMR